MRVPTLLLAVAAICRLVAAATSTWSHLDQELFEVQHLLEQAEGSGSDFYGFIGVDSPRASKDEINRAYRRRSLELHPDKNPGVPTAHDRFARLGVIATILRDDARRERYNHFLTNGFPRWRNTGSGGYLYSRWRPGAVSVIVGLVLLANAAHYGILRVQAARNRAHLLRNVAEAQQEAWGSNSARRPPEKRVRVAETGRIFDVMADGRVYLVDESDRRWLLDVDNASSIATWRNTILGILWTKLRPAPVNASPSGGQALGRGDEAYSSSAAFTDADSSDMDSPAVEAKTRKEKRLQARLARKGKAK